MARRWSRVTAKPIQLTVETSGEIVLEVATASIERNQIFAKSGMTRRAITLSGDGLDRTQHIPHATRREV